MFEIEKNVFVLQSLDQGVLVTLIMNIFKITKTTNWNSVVVYQYFIITQ